MEADQPGNWLLGIWVGLFILVAVLGGLRRIHFSSAVLPLNFVSIGLLVYPAYLAIQ